MKYGISKHFKRSEFQCACNNCGFDAVDVELLSVLEDVREHFDAPVYITSGNRCKAHNEAVGGSPTSQHVKGKAADIQVSGIDPKDVADYLDEMYPSAYGIGRYSTWTHIDTRLTKARWGSND